MQNNFALSYIENAPKERQEALNTIRKILLDTLTPLWFEECESYGMIWYVVPHSLYPKGYHVDPKLPLPFVALANQKHGIHLYHMGLYADQELHDWWTNAYTKLDIGRLDMGKSCIRWKNMKRIPYDLIRDLMTKIDAKDWISLNP